MTTICKAHTLLLSIALILSSIQGFAPVQRSTRLSGPHHGLDMAPRYDPALQRWQPTTEEDTAAYGYDAVKALLRHGPKAFLARTLNADEWEQAVLKFLATAGDCESRAEAEGNMDAYMENAQDWALNRLEAQKRGVKVNYTTLDKKQIALTVVWSSVVFFAIGRVTWVMQNGENFWDFLV